MLENDEREAKHTFARAHNGFAYLGIMSKVSNKKIRTVFSRLLPEEPRRRLFDRQNRFTFARNKGRVIHQMLELLDNE